MQKKKSKFRKNNRGNYQRKFHSHPFEKHENVVLKIDGISAQGHGVGRVNHTSKSGEEVNNWVIFVPFALPEEEVIVQVIHNAKKYSLAEIVKVIKPSDSRVEPKCSVFFYCGGCQLMHLSYEKQLVYKTQHLQTELNKIVKDAFTVLMPIPSPKVWNYRSKITPHYTKPIKGEIEAIGFIHNSKKDKIVDVHTCAIATDGVNQKLGTLREELHSRVKYDKSFKNPGSLLIREGEDLVATEPNSVVSETVNGVKFHFLAKDFFQNNASILAPFASYVSTLINDSGVNFLVDAYCGCGFFSLTNAAQVKEVKGVDVSATSVDWASYNANFNAIENVTYLAANAESIFSEINYPAEETCVIIDPPRAGCSKEFLAQLFDLQPKSVIYISCEPTTQIRDLESFLKHGYTIDSVQPFDLFPHTRHLESVIYLKNSY